MNLDFLFNVCWIRCLRLYLFFLGLVVERYSVKLFGVDMYFEDCWDDVGEGIFDMMLYLLSFI